MDGCNRDVISPDRMTKFETTVACERVTTVIAPVVLAMSACGAYVIISRIPGVRWATLVRLG